MSTRNFVIQDVVSASSGNVAASSAVATLAADANLFWYCTGFEIYMGGATAAAVVLATITGLLGGTITIPVQVQAIATGGVTAITVEFTQPLAGAAQNTAVVLTLPSGGAGNLNAAVVLHGFKGGRTLA